MNRSLFLLPLLAASCTTAVDEEASLAFAETVVEVPGFVDFLQVDGDTVWSTNEGRVEQWSREGKIATVEMPRPCGTMAMEAGSLWVGNCEGGELYRIGPGTGQVLARIPAGIGPSGEQNVVGGAGAVWAPNQAEPSRRSGSRMRRSSIMFLTSDAIYDGHRSSALRIFSYMWLTLRL